MPSYCAMQCREFVGNLKINFVNKNFSFENGTAFTDFVREQHS